MDEPNSAATQIAQPPFSDADADIVLRSSDSVDFRLHKSILARAFHGFEDLFAGLDSAAAYQTGGADAMGVSDQDGRPVLVVTERADVLDALFRIFYYVDSPTFLKLDMLRSVCLCLDRYCVKNVPSIIRELLIKAVSVPRQHGTSSGTVYALACRLQMDDIALVAARASLHNPDILRELPIQDVQLISSTQYHTLNVYFDDCRDVAAGLVSQPLFRISATEIPCCTVRTNQQLREYFQQGVGLDQQPRLTRTESCECSLHYTMAGTRDEFTGYPQLPHEHIVMPMWLSDYLLACSEELYRCPIVDIVTSPMFCLKYLRQAIACPYCSDYIDTFLSSFLGRMKTKINAELDQVKLIIAS